MYLPNGLNETYSGPIFGARAEAAATSPPTVRMITVETEITLLVGASIHH